MRALQGITGLIAAGALIVFWRGALDAVEEQAKVAAAQQIWSAANVLSFREDVRLRNVIRFGTELSAKAEVHELFASGKTEGLAAALATTSVGAGANSAIFIDRKSIRVWGNGQASTTEVKLPAITNALSGATELLILQPSDPLVSQLGIAPSETPVFVAAGPLVKGKEIIGAVVVAEPISAEFFNHLSQLTGVQLSLVQGGELLGTAPVEVKDVKAGEPTLVRTKRGAVFAQRVDFRVPPSFNLGGAVIAADASSLEKRQQKLHLLFALTFTALVIAMFLANRKPKA